MMKPVFAALAVSLILAAPLAAQSSHGNHGNHGSHGTAPAQSAHGQHGAGEGAMDCAMHGDAVHRHAPKLLLQHGEMLRLTPAQVEQLGALQAAHHGLCHPRMEQRKAAEAAATAALEQDTPDIAAFEARSREAANLKIECQVDMVRTGQRALGLLTAEQKTHLSHMSHMSQGNHPGQ
jgi:Spy/CpxP family protein refolding chaperone